MWFDSSPRKVGFQAMVFFDPAGDGWDHMLTDEKRMARRIKNHQKKPWKIVVLSGGENPSYKMVILPDLP